MAAFRWLEEQTLKYGDVLTRRPLLEEGFVYDGKKINMLGPKGIWKPMVMQYPNYIHATNESSYDDQQIIIKLEN
jgi:hypothetical protein